jgi:putative transposase
MNDQAVFGRSSHPRCGGCRGGRELPRRGKTGQHRRQHCGAVGAAVSADGQRLRATFYRWCDLYQGGGPEALEDRSPRPDRVWNRIPDAIRDRVIRLAPDEPALSPRELAVCFTDMETYFVSEASVYLLRKAHDLIVSPADIVMKAADEFKDKTTAPNQLWQTDFTYLKVTSWGWFYLSTVLDDFSRYIIAWKLCATMKADDVTATLGLALAASGLDWATVVHRPRLLTDNGASYIATDLTKWLDGQRMELFGAHRITHRGRSALNGDRLAISSMI